MTEIVFARGINPEAIFSTTATLASLRLVSPSGRYSASLHSPSRCFLMKTTLGLNVAKTDVAKLKLNCKV